MNSSNTFVSYLYTFSTSRFVSKQFKCVYVCVLKNVNVLGVHESVSRNPCHQPTFFVFLSLIVDCVDGDDDLSPDY
jgi:hypothetical protein